MTNRAAQRVHGSRHRSDALAVAPGLAVTVLAAAGALAGGAIPGSSWLPLALLTAMAAACSFAIGRPVRPDAPALIAIVSLLGLAAWQAVAVTWSPFPSLGIGEARLTFFYCLVVAGASSLAVRVASLRAAVATVAVAGVVVAAVAVGSVLTAEDAASLFYDGRRFAAPIDYPNAAAALFLVAFWPTIAVAAARSAPVAARVAGGAGASLLLGGWVMAQSRGAFVALLGSALVVFAVSRRRLRLVAPVTCASLPVAFAFDRLTAPFGAEGDAETLRRAATAAFAAACAGGALTLVYALVDRRTRLTPRARRAAGVAVATAFGLAAVATLAIALARIGDPREFVQEQWRAWTNEPESVGSSYLLTVGSNRYDVWRVALATGRDHPLGGVGTRGFLSEYLVRGGTDDTPHRAHSVALDAFSETGLVGLLLTVGALVVGFVAAARRGRTSVAGCAVLGTTTYWLLHASVDWLWTIPAVTLPVMMLFGVALAPRRLHELSPRAGAAAAVGVFLAAALAFGPPWLSHRLASAAGASESAEAAEPLLDWSQRLDPWSLEPLLVEARLVGPTAAPGVLRRAVEREPRSVGLRVLLARDELRAGNRAAAVRELRVARSLAPRDESIRDELQRLGGAG